LVSYSAALDRLKSWRILRRSRCSPEWSGYAAAGGCAVARPRFRWISYVAVERFRVM
jgi:hypothetical protein